MSLSGKRFLEVAGSREAAVTVLATITGVYYLIVALTNCIDTDTNRRGVEAVLSMHATIHHPATDWRAITNGTVLLIAYILVVAWEALTAVALLAGATAGWRGLAGRNPARITAAARLSSLGWVMAVLLFAGGFLTIGGEWFRMWANKQVNASSAALQNVILASIGLILVHLPARVDTAAKEDEQPAST
ncbi:putative small integral membrane protein [Nocardia transvalensis]|uniref:Putative small integral membrane protein n=1 Tax=Nocardia transvalensis TaxID=37333 RepID=A0A7W9PGA0_9NOCA|nr:DUF2165 domain-containing protein [Nocardia transvalensis]MBB5915624.1 putative small integral membrane protein [Nocardia transvalensis]